jgi:tRNA1Val (adenine37-N6)-methyltransferase
MFQFKQFAIQHNKCAMKVGTDGVLLGAWADAAHAARILDIGTGTGLLALMLAQRQPTATIDAIEIEENACRQAAENVVASRWHTNISVFHTSLQAFEPSGTYDLIVSNPLYFSQSLKNPDVSKQTARHNDTLLPEELTQHAKRLLHANGRIAVIYPLQEARVFLSAAQKIGFYCRRITRVIPAIGGTAKRMLVELSTAPCLLTENELCIETTQRHVYTNEYISLTKDFYLKF